MKVRLGFQWRRPYVKYCLSEDGAHVSPHPCTSAVWAGSRRTSFLSIVSRGRQLSSSACELPRQHARGTSHDDSVSSPIPPKPPHGRIEKLRTYDAFHYPRLSHQPNRTTIANFRERYHLEDSTPPEGAMEDVVVEGRITSIRRLGSKLCFIQMTGGYQQVQVVVNLAKLSDPKPDLEHFTQVLHPLRRGDFISAKGRAIRTPNRELSLGVTELPSVISPCLTPLPESLDNKKTIALNRHLDLLVNPRASALLRLRSSIIRSLRDFLHDRDFLEVQTPILADSVGGATARPFLTSATEFPEKDLALRIAPELWLKRLVVGGNDRVFEIGPSFRNEGLDTTHNPEFTTCEFYAAYLNLPDLIALTEDLISDLAGHSKLLSKDEWGPPMVPDFSLPSQKWRQVEFIPGLEEVLGLQLPDLSSPDALNELSGLLTERTTFPVTPGISLNKLLDQLASEYLEGLSPQEPSFVTHHPACMSPLAKSFTCPKTGQLVSARAELFIGGFEIANMYEEENDPIEQRRKFELQAQSRKAHGNDPDEGPPEIDESYIDVLKCGLPPTGGWGAGIDRLVMLLSGTRRINDVLSFGSLQNVVSLSTAARSALSKG